MRIPGTRSDYRAGARFPIRARLGGLLLICALALGLTVTGIAAGASRSGRAAIAAPPANDAMQNAQIIHALPATFNGTVVGASTELNEVNSSCASQQTIDSVWYSLKSSGAQRIAVQLAAAGKLEASVDVYHVQRSQLQPVTCQQTSANGEASLSFNASKNGVYEIRVAALQSSQLAGFTLEVFLPTPAVMPPGRSLPAAGVAGKVDRIQNVNAAYSFILHSGVSYLINLANQTPGGCVDGALFAPGTSSFEGGQSLVRVHCGGYRLFTPGPGEGGRYSYEITPRTSFAGNQRFHLQLSVAGPAETAPGLALGNYARVRGHLNGAGIQVLRLYRLEIHSHSNLTLKLSAPESAAFNLKLLDQDGHLLACACESSGPQKVQHQMRPGRYYAVVSVRGRASGNFTLMRQSRTITATTVSFGAFKVSPGQSVGIDVKVSPAVGGPVTVDIERFDPVFGWQFYRAEQAQVQGGSATLPFTAPSIGRWRVHARYEGSRVASPSATGFADLLVN